MNRVVLCLVLSAWLFVSGALSSLSAEEGVIPSVEQSVSEYRSDKPWRKKDPDPKKDKKKTVSSSKKYKKMARALLGQPHWSERFLGLLDRDTPKIAIHPFQADELPISLEEAQIYVNGFTQALVREADGRYAVVARKELGALVQDINEMGMRSESENPLGDLITRARSDLLAVGTLSLKGDKILLAYKMVETETGRIVSSSQQAFARKNETISKAHGGLSVNGAAQKAAGALLRDVNFVRKIMVQGIRYQTSGIHTGFGRYFTGVLVDSLRQYAASGPRNINSMEISDFVIEEERFRGLELSTNSVERTTLSQDGQGSFILKGTYWPFEEYVEIRLSLENEKGAAHVWRGRIVKSEIPPELDLLPPPSPIAQEETNSLGPIDLYLSSNKGKDPSYKVGQKMVLSVRTTVDAYIGCYYLQADGMIFRIFPNRFVKSGFLNGGFTQNIPSASMPFAFEFTPPSGVEAVKCFATDRDVSKDLTTALGQAAFKPLSVANERQLTKVFRSLPNVLLSEASLIISVE